MSRSRTYSMRCAAPPALLSNSPGLLALVVVFITGGLLFALGTFMVRREARAQTPVVEQTVVDLDARLDAIERLAMVGQPWCVEQLEREFLSDSDERVRNAAEDALLVIAARSG